MRLGPPTPSSVFAGLVCFVCSLAGYGILHAMLTAFGVFFLTSEIVEWTPILRRRWWK